MGLLTSPRLHSPPFLLKTSASFRNRRSCSSPAVKMKLIQNRDSAGTAILWFKHDLRIDDHTGLLAASKYRAVVPVYVFDHRILSRFSDKMLVMIVSAVEDLRKSLKDRGSGLVIRFGNAESVMEELVNQVKATCIFAEEEVEYNLCLMMNIVKEKLDSVKIPEGSPKIIFWKTPFYAGRIEDLPTSYDDFKELGLPITTPLPPCAIPSAEMELDWGPLPTHNDLMDFMSKNPRQLDQSWVFIKARSAETLFQEKVPKPIESNGKKASLKYMLSNKVNESVFVSQNGKAVRGGTSTVLNALAAYLRCLDGNGEDDLQEVYARVIASESRDGSLFVELFGPALCLGIVSRRRVYNEAIKYKEERNARFLIGYSATTIAATVNAVCSMEWYWLMALRSAKYDGTQSDRIWRWNGFLIKYKMVGNEGPAILLVHGFGAFWEHYRDNIQGIAEGGNRVWAITLLGFGTSEKPNVFYTELLWAELLRDFIVEVVGEPAHLVGNSLGGYIVAIVGHLWSMLIKSVVLINSAGIIIPRHSFAPFTKERLTSGVSWLGSRLLLFYLRLQIQDILVKCYPTMPDRADDFLLNEMLRTTNDPGALVVLESIFSVNLSFPLNYLLEDLKENIIIIQGMKDPISDSKSKVAMLKEHLSGVLIKELDAGHCPHDELPEQVNHIICNWVTTIESKSFVECSY